MRKLTTFLWFNGNAEAAVDFYQTVFTDLEKTKTTYYGPNMHEPEGTVLTVEFNLFDHPFVALNAGPQYTPNPAVSFMIACQDQAEVDRYWNALLEGGEPLACGWITDRFGFAWQITPRQLMEWIEDPDPVKAARVTQAMMGMIKLDIEELKRAYEG